jgi:hypothetical protein
MIFGLTMKKRILTLLLALLLVANMNSQGVLAVTIDFQWLGNQGYIAKGSFSYDEKTAPTIFSEKGSGKMQVLEDFQVSFYDNSGQESALGGEGMGEIYLQGVVKDNLALLRVESVDLVMDEDDSPEIITQF